MLPLYIRARETWKSMVRKVRDDVSGATAIEYGLIAAGIAVAIIGIVFTLGNEISSMFASIQSQVNSRNPGG